MLKKILVILTSQRATNSILALIAVFTFISLFHIGERSKLNATFSDEMFIGQEIGSLKFYHSIAVKNIGKKTGFITKIKGYIRSKESERTNFSRSLECRYYLDDKSNFEKPFLEIPLSIDESFNSDIRLYNKIGRFDVDSTAIFQNRTADEGEAAQKMGLDLRLKSTSKRLSRQIKNFILSRIADLKQGEYEYIIGLYDEQNALEPFSYKCYSFTLYDSNIRLLKETIKSYQKLAQPFHTNFNRANVHVYMTEINNTQSIKSLLGALQKP